MKEFFDVTVLALLQGVAEFLPVSSSGHLVVAQHALGLDMPGMRLDIALHAGTLIAVFAFYRKTLGGLLYGLFVPAAASDARRAAWIYTGKLFLSALPAVVVYFTFKAHIDALFENAKMVGALLMFTGAVLSGTRLLPRGGGDVGFLRALLMGLGQALALLPGVSRSGMTLASARAGGVDPEKAAAFSFLMSAPLIVGAVLLDCVSASPAVSGPSTGVLVWGVALSAVTGYAALAFLLHALKGKWFWLFGPYCIAAGLATLVLCR